MSEALYKQFPPGLGLLRVPTHSRKAALAGLVMYAPCATRGVLAHRVALLATSIFGPRVLPGRSSVWTPPMPPDVWENLQACWRREVGEFDSMAIYERVQVHRPGLALLLLRHDEPVAFVKLRQVVGTDVRREAAALEALAKYGPSTFFVPNMLGAGSVASWHYVSVEPIPGRRHKVVSHPPIELIAREIRVALADLPKPEGTPSHWVPMHGDLTPWNLRELADRRIVLTDWEESGWGPPGADEILYRATASASLGEASGRSDDLEAIEFWEKEVCRRPTNHERDRRLEESLARALRSMPLRAARKLLPARPKPRILVFAYACEPDRGSEPGAGWGLVRAVEAFADCTVLVGPEHIPGLRKWKATNPASTLRFIEVPEGRLAAAAKLHRVPWFLLYRRWLRTARRLARQLHTDQPFDAMYHATYATYWLPTPATEFGVPCVWGPVGGAVTTPPSLWRALGLRGVIDELFDLVSVRLASLGRATRNTWSRAAGQIIQNRETLARLPKSVRERAHLLSHVNFVEMPPIEPRPRGQHVVWVSSLEARKGPRLALHALAHTPEDVRLYMIGDGPERKSLERLARRLGIVDRVAFLGQMPRQAAIQAMSEAACVLFTNLREEGGVAVAEAMLTGAPTVLLANGGLRMTAASAKDPRRVRLVTPGGFTDTANRLAAAMTEFTHKRPASSEPNLDRRPAHETLQRIFEVALSQPSRSSSASNLREPFAARPLARVGVRS
jgi:glycosyltransferase involved in cell wall biosynthesis